MPRSRTMDWVSTYDPQAGSAVMQRPKPKRQKSYVSGVSADGKPCPTCYAQMTLDGQSQWMCAKHGEPAKP